MLMRDHTQYWRGAHGQAIQHALDRMAPIDRHYTNTMETLEAIAFSKGTRLPRLLKRLQQRYGKQYHESPRSMAKKLIDILVRD